jgi:hypothetical protein
MDERLVVLNEEGVYRVYDLQGDYQQYSLGTEAGELGVVDARIHENGLVALTGSLTLLEVKDWEGGRPLTLANPGKLIMYSTNDSTQTTTRIQVLQSRHTHGQ